MDFKNLKILFWLTGCRGPTCTSMLYFVEIGQTVFEVIIFFKMVTATVLDFNKCKILLADGVQRSELPHCAKSSQNGSIYCRQIAIFHYFNWRPPPSWISKILKFHWLTGFRAGSRYIIVRNFVKIRKSVAGKSWFFDFWRQRPPPSWNLNFWNYLGWPHLEGREAQPCQISSKLVNPLPKYYNFSIFLKMAAGAILDFRNS